MNAVKRAANVLLSVILWAVILVAALYAFTTMATRDNQNVSNLFGYTPLVVKSDSMAPTFETGDLIVIKKCDPQTLKEGDIICFHTIINNEYALNTHRIKSIEAVGDARSYTTIGDNNNGIADQHVISDGDIMKICDKYSEDRKSNGLFIRKYRFLDCNRADYDVALLYLSGISSVTISINLKKAIAVETAKEQESANMQAAKDAEAALAEAKRMREEAEAIRAQAQADLEKAKQVSDESKSGKE